MHGSSGQKKIGNCRHAGFCAAAILLLAVLVAHAERLPVRVYTSADGLGSSASFNLVRDRRGFIWLCSRDGLVRFDGYRFITYRIGNDDADPAVFDLIPTRNGAYWINLNRGTDYRLVPKSDARPLEPLQQSAASNDPRIPLNAEPVINAPLPNFEDAAGNLWTADAKGIYLLHEADGRLQSERVDLYLPGLPKSGLSLVVFKRGQEEDFWVGTNWGLVRRLPDGRMIHFTISPKNDDDLVRYFVEDKNSRVWMARPDGLIVLKVDELAALKGPAAFTARKAALKRGTVSADGRTQLPEQVGEAISFSFADILLRERGNKAGPAHSATPEIYEMICASDGKIWMTSSRGVIVFDGTKFHHYTSRQGLAADVFSSIVEDGEGHIWLASYGGLHRINPRGLTEFDEADGLERARVHSIYENRNGELQVVSGNFNISSLEGGVFKMARPRIPLDALWQWQTSAAFLDSRGDWWVNINTGVYRFTGVKRIEELAGKQPSAVYTSANGLISDDNLRVFEDSKGDIWIGTFVTSNPTGLTRWQRATGKFEHFYTRDGLPDVACPTAFAEDRAGTLWFGFVHGGIARYRNGRFTTLDVKDGLQPGGITSIYNDRSGRMWIASTQGGLSRVDEPEAEHPAFRHYTLADGLASNNTRCITEDLFGNIYIGTVRGVNRLSPDTGRIKYYGTSDGLASDFISVAYRDHEGAIWFGTFNGLSKLVPEPDTPLQPPDVLISGLRIAGVDYSLSPLGQREVFVPEQSADRNNLQIDFLSINTGGNVSTRYQYKLEGVDTEWSSLAAERSVTFANLSPGAYRFLVRAINADEMMSPQPAVVSFTVLRPFWQQWWFMTLAAAVAGLAAYAFYRYRVRRLIELERVRTRIATDLHDDIGSNLSLIAMVSEVARHQINQESSPVTDQLSLVARTSRQSVDAMSDIVWAVNPKRDHLHDLVERMRRFASDTFAARDIDFKFAAPASKSDLKLGSEFRRQVYMIFKESLNNMAKHSECSEAEIDLSIAGGQLTLRLSDNGKGFDTHATGNGYGGNGLDSMSQRAVSLGGTLDITSQQGAGTTVTLKAPLGRR
jgi:signal transduction histidine kinase/ligand-binding sensor domain-containing protein